MTADFEGSFEQRGRVLLQELENLPGEEALYGFLIRQGNVLVPLAEEWKTDVQLLQGCQYRVWLHLELKDGVVQIHADSDSLISRGLMPLWVRLFSGLTPGEVMASPPRSSHLVAPLPPPCLLYAAGQPLAGVLSASAVFFGGQARRGIS